MMGRGNSDDEMRKIRVPQASHVGYHLVARDDEWEARRSPHAYGRAYSHGYLNIFGRRMAARSSFSAPDSCHHLVPKYSAESANLLPFFFWLLTHLPPVKRMAILHGD